MFRFLIVFETIVALGDSVTLGIRRDGSVTADQTFAAILARTPGRKVINAGIGGNNTDQMLARLESDALSHRPDTVIVMAGLNDAAYIDPGPVARTWPRVSAERFESNLRRMVRAIRESGAKPVLMTPNPMTPGYLYSGIGFYRGNDINHSLVAYRESVLSVAREEKVCFADIFDAFQRQSGWQKMLPDGIHPNPDGHTLIAATVEQACLRGSRQ